MSAVRALLAAPKVEPFLGVRFSPHGLAEAVQAVAGREPSAPFAYVVTPNAQHTVAAYRGDPRYLHTQAGAWLTLNDSRILRLLAQLLFKRTLPLAAGSDLVETLFAEGWVRGAPITLIGGDTAMAQQIRRRYAPGRVAQHIPPMGFYRDPVEIARCAAFVRQHPARYVFLIVGAPQSELLAQRIAEEGGSGGVGLCVGSALNFLTGRVKRAPRLMQIANLEWLYRLAMNPRGHARRVFVESAPILWIALCERLAEASGREG